METFMGVKVELQIFSNQPRDKFSGHMLWSEARSPHFLDPAT